jgi:hypothetical protein
MVRVEKRQLTRKKMKARGLSGLPFNFSKTADTRLFLIQFPMIGA